MNRCPNCGRQYRPVRDGQVFCSEVCKDRWCAIRAKHRQEKLREQRLNTWRTR